MTMAHDKNEDLPQLPEFGFYYHYKHDPDGPLNNYAYFVFNVGYHTEDDCRLVDQWSVDYLPLYDSHVFRIGKGKVSDSRPLSMFMSTVQKDGKTIPRFTKIQDASVIDILMGMKKAMYPNRP